MIFDKIKYLFVSDYFFTTPPETLMLWIWFLLFAVLGVTVLSLYVYYKIRGRRERPFVNFSKNFLWPNLIIVLLGFFNVFSRYEGLTFFSWRLWSYLIVTGALCFNVWFYVVKYADLQDDLVKFHDKKRKEKWLKKKK